jgi:succinoglycan biosynthesis protein ExoW
MSSGANRPTMKSADAARPQATRIGVLIPYFQQEAGLLQRALASVAAQEHRPVQVIVVDDGSPRSADDEITPALTDAIPELVVVRQPNRGVAAARNAGLDALSDEVSAIALLDSDDYWEPSHLRHAAAALSLGADFFFSNSRFEGEATDFYQTRPQRDLLCNSRAAHEATAIVRWPASVSELFADGCPFHTSTVVFRRAVMPELRFSTNFRRAGEDHAAFWELVTRSSAVMFCTEPTLISGAGGIGLWRKSTFGSVASLVRLADELRWLRQLISSDLLGSSDRQLIQRAIAARRQQALTSALHLLWHRHNAFKELAYLLRTDPGCTAYWCLGLPRLLYGKIRGGSRSAN